MFKWQKLNIITNIIPDLCTLISNVKDSIVCSCFWKSIDYSGIRYHVYDWVFSVFASSSKPFKRPEREYGRLLGVGPPA